MIRNSKGPGFWVVTLRNDGMIGLNPGRGPSPYRSYDPYLLNDLLAIHHNVHVNSDSLKCPNRSLDWVLLQEIGAFY